jgi:acetylglutamate kinase
LIARVAADMDQYVQRMEAELPLFSKHLNKGMNALVQAAAMAIEFKVKDVDLGQAKENLEAVRKFSDTLTGVEGQITTFQNTIASFP